MVSPNSGFQHRPSIGGFQMYNVPGKTKAANTENNSLLSFLLKLLLLSK